MLKFSSVVLIVLLATSAFAQKSNRNSAIKVFHEGQSLIASGDQEKGKEKLRSAANFIDLAESDQQTSRDFETLQAMGDIYLELTTVYINEKDPNSAYTAGNKSKLGYLRSLSATTVNSEIDAVHEQLKVLEDKLFNEAITQYSLKNQSVSNQLFVLSYDVADLRGEIDGQRSFTVAMSCEIVKDFNNALRYYEKSAALNFGGSELYSRMLNCAVSAGGKETIAKVISDGEAKFPNDQVFIISVANVYLMTEDYKNAVVTLEKVVKNDPSNVSYIHALGSAYEKIGKLENAETNYKAALAIDPDFFAANYGMGILRYNEAAKHLYKLNVSESMEPDTELTETYHAALQETRKYLEKAHQSTPSDYSTLSSLKHVYLQLEMTDEFNEVSIKLERIKSGL